MAVNIFAQGMGAFDRSYESAQRMADQRARKKSGGRIAQGDYQGAASELASAGLIDDARVLQNDIIDREDRAYDRERQGRMDQQQMDQRQQAMAAKQGEMIVEVAKNLQQVPVEQRAATLQKLAPLFDHMGLGADWIAQVTPDQLTDQALTALAGEVESKIKLFNTASGVVAVDQQALAQGDPNAARQVYQDPLAVEYKRAQIGATNARAGASSASAEAARARAARTRSGSASGGGSSAEAMATLQALKAELARRRGGN